MENGRFEVCLVSMRVLVVAACCRLFVRDVEGRGGRAGNGNERCMRRERGSQGKRKVERRGAEGEVR